MSHVRVGAERAKRDPREIDVVSYIFTCIATDKQAAVRSSRKTIAYFGRLEHYRKLFTQEGFVKEVELLKQAWAQNDVTRATQAVSDEMVDTLSASGSADDVAGRINALLNAGLKQAVIFPFPADGSADGAKEAMVKTIEALSS